MGLPKSCKVIAFIATQDIAEAKKFYGEQLGLPQVGDDGFAVVFDARGTMLRVAAVRKAVIAEYTVLGWEVTDIAEAARGLLESGVVLQRFPGLEQDELGVWTAPGGNDRVAWFKDPDGNVLSVSQHSGL